jgi:hypothetical protein
MKTYRTFLGWAAAAVLFTFHAGTATAATIHYDESVDGDIGWNNPWVLFPLGVGTNTVTGTVGLVPDAWEFDTFTFSVPAGARLTQLDVALADVNGDVSWVDWVLAEYSTPERNILQILRVDSPGSGSFTAALPLEAGTYSIGENSLAPLTVSWALTGYTFTFTVEAPEPGSVIGVGLLAGALVRRRRRSGATWT